MLPFDDILASLNDKQREAVETIYGPVLVIAGPGSGKTQLLSARIANILRTTDYLPSNILCLTFTENAARNMRDRLAKMIGQDAYRVAIHTFHSFGNEIINRFRYLSKEYNDAKTIDRIESSRILDSILESLPWDSPYKPGYRASDTIKEVLGSIENLKKGGVTPEIFHQIIEQNQTTLALLNPIITEYFGQIDILGQKKEDKEKKIEIFKQMTIKVQQMLINEAIGGSYEPLGIVISRSLTESWEINIEDNSTKFLGAWRDTWTERDYQGKRKLKETSKLDKQIALADIYKQYQKMLEEKGYIDFSDMILHAIKLVETNDIVRMSLAETYQFVMIDEFQDTNEAQMRLIHGIVNVDADNPNIFAVGDDDQSIYKFQGANTKNIRQFHDSYSDTELIILEENYRSKAEIITASRTVIESQSGNLSTIFEGAHKEFRAIRESGGVVQRKKFQNTMSEFSWIIEDIEKSISNGISPSEIAVITKKNKTLELIAKGLLEKGISVNISKDESIFDTEEVILIVSILKYIRSLDGTYSEENAELLISILSHPCFDIDRLTIWNISKSIYHSRKDTTRSWIENLSTHTDEKLRNLAHFLQELTTLSRVSRLEDLIDYITGANSLSIPDDYDDDGKTNPLQIDLLSGERGPYVSPLFAYFFGRKSNHKGTNTPIKHRTRYVRHLSNIRAFIEGVRSYKSGRNFLCLHDAMDLLTLIEKYDLDITINHTLGDEAGSVNLITVYKAKGLEWKSVYVPNIVRSEYKLGRISGSPLPKNLPLEAERDDDEDIERLIYTAITRAKDSATLTYADKDFTERANEPIHCIEQEDSLFEELTTVAISSLETTLEVEKNDLFALPYLGEERDFLRDRIEKQFVMNATALQNFLNIADAGPEYFVANTLLRFPQAKNIAASYGSAIHKALEDFFADYATKKTYKKDILFTSFEEYLKKEGFDQNTETTYLDRGRKNLESLYEEISGRTYTELFLEYDFRAAHGGTFLPVDEDRAIQLTGKIDRIERLPDDTLLVTDYKTGSGFDVFDGKGASYEKVKQWKYRLQLCFYAILFELSPRWRMFEKKQFELFFVEKNRDEDRFHRVVEYIQSGEIERTKRLIIAVMSKIQDLDFPDVSKYEKTIDGIRQFEEDLLNGQI